MHQDTNPMRLAERFRTKQASVGVIGLGYVGLPLSLAAAGAGFQVLGFDTDPNKIQMISKGDSYLSHVPAPAVAAAVGRSNFAATCDFARLGEPDALLICVPTPITAHHEPDLSFVLSTVQAIAKHIRSGQLVVLESTTYPGTTNELLRPILQSGGLRCDRDFFLAFAPEREDPGNPNFAMPSIPKIVGAEGPHSLLVATALYETFIEQVIPVSDTKTAEAVKLTENIFRSVNIALANELKFVFDAMNIDIWEVIESAKTKPFGFMPFYPGPGLGGHCIPIDPFYLSWKAKQYGITTRFVELAGQINSSMPEFVISKLLLALDDRQRKGLNGSRILILGASYKKNVGDLRESPALNIMSRLEARGAIIDYFDPFVPSIPKTRGHPGLAGRRCQPWHPLLSSNYDAVLIVTDHDNVDYGAVVENAKLVVDARNACRRNGIKSTKIVFA